MLEETAGPHRLIKQQLTAALMPSVPAPWQYSRGPLCAASPQQEDETWDENRSGPMARWGFCAYIPATLSSAGCTWTSRVLGPAGKECILEGVTAP